MVRCSVIQNNVQKIESIFYTVFMFDYDESDTPHTTIYIKFIILSGYCLRVVDVHFSLESLMTLREKRERIQRDKKTKWENVTKNSITNFNSKMIEVIIIK